MTLVHSTKLLNTDVPKIYTITDRQCKPYTIQLSKTPEKKYLTKTTIVAFRNQIDAYEMAYLLETHKRNRNEWPTNIFENSDDINDGFSLYGDIRNMDKISLIELKIVHWNNIALESYCARNILDILYILNFDQTNSNRYIIKGQLHRIDADIQYYIEILNKKIKNTN